MSLTITLPDPLPEILEQRATRLHIPVDELAIRLLKALLLDVEFDSLASTGKSEKALSLEDTVAKIKRLPPNPVRLERGAKVGDLEYIDYLLANPPQDTMTVEEWKEFWPAVEKKLKQLDPVYLPTE